MLNDILRLLDQEGNQLFDSELFQLKVQLAQTRQHLHSAENALKEKDVKLQELKTLNIKQSQHIKDLSKSLERSRVECQQQSDSANFFLEKALKLRIELDKQIASSGLSTSY